MAAMSPTPALQMVGFRVQRLTATDPKQTSLKMRSSSLVLPPNRAQNAYMGSKTLKSETVKVSRLGCIRKSTVEIDTTGSTIEHVEVWVDEPTVPDTRSQTDGEPRPSITKSD